jgi:hypothetical protein
MTQEDKDQALREHLLYLLRGGGAHIGFDEVLDEFPEELYNARGAGVDYTPWQLLEHLRLAQWDILEFSRNSAHASPKWPEGYWPDRALHTDAEGWRASVAAFRADLRAMEELVADPSQDLYAPIPHGTGQTLLREALLVADHNSYHLGALVMLRNSLKAQSSSLRPDIADRF